MLRMTLMSGKVKVVKREGQVLPDSNSVITLSPSPLATPSIRGQFQQQERRYVRKWRFNRPIIFPLFTQPFLPFLILFFLLSIPKPNH